MKETFNAKKHLNVNQLGSRIYVKNIELNNVKPIIACIADKENILVIFKRDKGFRGHSSFWDSYDLFRKEKYLMLNKTKFSREDYQCWWIEATSITDIEVADKQLELFNNIDKK